MAFPSYREGLPNAVVEAIACGKPVVATNVGGIPEIITSGINGLLIRVGDIGELSSNIMRILTDTTLRKRLGQRGRQIAENRFNAREHAKNLSVLFRRVVEEHTGTIKA